MMGCVSLFADGIILHIESPMDSTKKHFDLIIEYGKTVGYKVNSQKSYAFLYTNNKYQKQKAGKKIPFAIEARKLKYLGINLTRRFKTCTQNTTQH